MPARNQSYFLQNLTLRNFMLHRLTSIDLSGHPILLLTGANGSGKTQILDAFILALGGHPKRLKKGKVSDAIGPFEAECRIELTLANPKIEESRTLNSLDRKVVELVDCDRFTVEVEIKDETGAHYFLKNADGRHKIMRKDLRDLLGSLNLHADNKLAFTEEGTVNVFSDHSDRNKLDLLLETTGLTAYRENIANTFESIDKATRALDPLRRKLALEREYLQSMERAREMARRKEEMIEKHRALVVEEAWSHVALVEKESEETRSKVLQKQRQHEDAVNRGREVEHSIQKCRTAFRQSEEHKKRLYREVEESRNQASELQGANRSNQRVLENCRIKIESLEEQLKEWTHPDRLSESGKLARELADLRRRKIRMEALQARLGSYFFSPGASEQRETLADALKFRRAAEEQGIEVHGPLFLEIGLADGAPAGLWEAMASLLSERLFWFAAPGQGNFERAVAAMRGMWPEKPPAFAVARTDAAPQAEIPPALSFVRAPAPVMAFLCETLSLEIARDWSESAWLQAQKRGRSVWHGHYLYLPRPAAGGIFCPGIFAGGPLGLSAEELDDALRLEENHRRLLEREQALDAALLKLDKSEDIRRLEAQVQEHEENASELRNEIQVNLGKGEELERRILEKRQEYEAADQEADGHKKQLGDAETEFRRIEEEQENLEKFLNLWRQKLEDQETDLRNLRLKAEDAGPRPPSTRHPNIVAQERTHLEGRLESLQISVVTEADFQAQGGKVQKLETELSGGDEHLRHLKEDIEKRFAEWHVEVSRRIQAISESMNHLLSGIVQGVRLRVDNLKDPARAGLQIEVRRHGQTWHDLSQLSGGEKVLTVEALILALHLQTDSPIHAIDECTQRLDMQFKTQAFEMVQAALAELERVSAGPFSPQFLLLAPDTLGVRFDEDFERYFKQIVLAPAQLRKSQAAK